ncbi:MAG: ABC-2 family transporter protein [Limnochordia bacterium]
MSGIVETLRTYTAFTLCFLKAKFIYRASFWISLSINFLFLLMQVYLWKALLGTGSLADTTVNEMITYVVMASVIRNILLSRAALTIEDRLLSGDIVFDFIRPLSFRVQLLLNDLGQALSSFLLQSVPLMAAALVFVGINPPESLIHLIAFIFLAIGGMIISFYTSYIIGLVAFYTMKAEYLEWLIGTINTFLSGRYLPLWLYPAWLRVIAEIAPFKLMYYTPIAVYMGRIPLSELPAALLTMFVWLFLLIGIEFLLWKKTTNKLVVQGG